MAAFSYRALDANGKLSKGIMEGDSERQVRSQLRGQGLKPVEVGPSGGKPKSKKGEAGDNKAGASLFKTRVKTADLALITRQLATLIQSSMPLDEALSRLNDNVETVAGTETVPWGCLCGLPRAVMPHIHAMVSEAFSGGERAG